MAIKRSASVRRKASKKIAARMGDAEITRHAVSIVALLVNERCLTISDARAVLSKALLLLRED